MFIETFKKKIASGLPNDFFRKLDSFGFTPNRLTVISMFFKVGASVAFLYQKPLVAGFLILFDFAFDFLDGSVARATGKVTTRGGYLDFLSDRFLRAFWVIAAVYGGYVNFELAMWVVLVEMLAYFAGQYLEFKQLKHFKWLIPNHSFVVYGAFLIQYIEQLLLFGLFFNGLLAIIQIIGGFWLNREE